MACHIKLENLAFTYRWKAYQKHIFKDLTLCVTPGSFVTIVGGNGSGKSSLLRMILGLLAPDSGKIFLNGDIVRPGYPEAVRKNQIAYLSQQIEELFFSETVREEISYGSDTQNSSGVYSACKKLGIDDLLDRKVENLSGGERQSLALAQFMDVDASLLILDEPSSYLDRGKADILREYLQVAHHSGKTILHVTQFEKEVAWGSHVIDLNLKDIGISET